MITVDVFQTHHSGLEETTYEVSCKSQCEILGWILPKS